MDLRILRWLDEHRVAWLTSGANALRDVAGSPVALASVVLIGVFAGWVLGAAIGVAVGLALKAHRRTALVAQEGLSP